MIENERDATQVEEVETPSIENISQNEVEAGEPYTLWGVLIVDGVEMVFCEDINGQLVVVPGNKDLPRDIRDEIDANMDGTHDLEVTNLENLDLQVVGSAGMKVEGNKLKLRGAKPQTTGEKPKDERLLVNYTVTTFLREVSRGEVKVVRFDRPSEDENNNRNDGYALVMDLDDDSSTTRLIMFHEVGVKPASILSTNFLNISESLRGTLWKEPLSPEIGQVMGEVMARPDYPMREEQIKNFIDHNFHDFHGLQEESARMSDLISQSQESELVAAWYQKKMGEIINKFTPDDLLNKNMKVAEKVYSKLRELNFLTEKYGVPWRYPEQLFYLRGLRKKVQKTERFIANERMPKPLMARLMEIYVAAKYVQIEQTGAEHIGFDEDVRKYDHYGLEAAVKFMMHDHDEERQQLLEKRMEQETVVEESIVEATEGTDKVEPEPIHLRARSPKYKIVLPYGVEIAEPKDDGTESAATDGEEDSPQPIENDLHLGNWRPDSDIGSLDEMLEKFPNGDGFFKSYLESILVIARTEVGERNEVLKKFRSILCNRDSTAEQLIFAAAEFKKFTLINGVAESVDFLTLKKMTQQLIKIRKRWWANKQEDKVTATEDVLEDLRALHFGLTNGGDATEDLEPKPELNLETQSQEKSDQDVEKSTNYENLFVDKSYEGMQELLSFFNDMEFKSRTDESSWPKIADTFLDIIGGLDLESDNYPNYNQIMYFALSFEAFALKTMNNQDIRIKLKEIVDVTKDIEIEGHWREAIERVERNIKIIENR